MYVASLAVSRFRNYASQEVSLGPGITVFVGANGQGKTNLLEGIVYLATLGSHRVSTDDPLIQAGEQDAILRLVIGHGARRVELAAHITRGRARQLYIGGRKARPADVAGKVLIALFSPEDLQLLKGDPGLRRRFVDGVVRQRHPRMVDTYARYDRVLRQRNTLLKQGRAPHQRQALRPTLEVFNRQLAALGTTILRERARLVGDLLPALRGSYRAIAGHEAPVDVRLTISERPEEGERAWTEVIEDETLEDAFRARLADVESAEFDRGVTLVGPHRDDVQFVLNELTVKAHASHGETWSYALALKLAMAELLKAESIAGDPILLLDDVFAELDQQRRERLAEAIQDYEQVLITSAVEDDIPERLRGHRVTVSRGTLLDADRDAVADEVGEDT